MIIKNKFLASFLTIFPVLLSAQVIVNNKLNLPAPDANIIIIETTGCGTELNSSECTSRRAAYNNKLSEAKRMINSEGFNIPTFIYALGVKRDDNNTYQYTNPDILKKLESCGLEEKIEKNEAFLKQTQENETDNLPIAGNFISSNNNEVVYQCWKYNKDIEWSNRSSVGLSETNSASFTLKRKARPNSDEITGYEVHPQLVSILPSLLMGFGTNNPANSFNLYLISDTKLSSLEFNTDDKPPNKIGYIFNKNSLIQQKPSLKWGVNNNVMLNKWRFEKQVILPVNIKTIKQRTTSIEIPYVSSFYTKLKLLTQEDEIIVEPCTKDHQRGSVLCTYDLKGKEKIYENVTKDAEKTIYLTGLPIDNLGVEKLNQPISIYVTESYNINIIDDTLVIPLKKAGFKKPKIQIYKDVELKNPVNNNYCKVNIGEKSCTLDKKLEWGKYYFLNPDEEEDKIFQRVNIKFHKWNNFSDLGKLHSSSHDTNYIICDNRYPVLAVQEQNPVEFWDKIKIIWHNKETLIAKEGSLCFDSGKDSNNKPNILAYITINNFTLWLKWIGIVILSLLIICLIWAYFYLKAIKKFRTTAPTITIENTEDNTNANT